MAVHLVFRNWEGEKVEDGVDVGKRVKDGEDVGRGEGWKGGEWRECRKNESKGW